MIQVRRGVVRLSVVGVAVLGGLSLSACATKDYVDQRISEVNTRISAVDQKADQALSTAQAAQATASQNSQRIDQLTATVNNLQQTPPPARSPHG
jgi:outer membrane murein-binding lipoprotein Lpp